MTPAGDHQAEAGDGLRPVVAAGAVLWRRQGEDLQVCLVHRPRYDDWSLPKGKRDDGEHLLRTAVREVEEETGATARLGSPLGTIDYDVLDAKGRTRRKVVHFWTAEHLSGDHVPNDEVDRLTWCSLPEARTRLTRAAEADVLDRFAAAALDTTPLVVLRHAQAVPRSGWHEDDARRPLSELGRAQSQRLADSLAAFGELEVVTSPSVRTRQTVEPYLRRSGRQPRVDARLREERRLGEEARLLDSWLGRAAVLCTHRPVLPVLLDALRAGTDSTLPPVSPLPPAGFVVAHVRRTARGWRTAAWEQHDA